MHVQAFWSRHMDFVSAYRLTARAKCEALANAYSKSGTFDRDGLLHCCSSFCGVHTAPWLSTHPERLFEYLKFDGGIIRNSACVVYPNETLVLPDT